MARRLYLQMGGGKCLLLWGLTLLFGLSQRTGQALPWDLHILAVLNDQYYFIFAVLPVMLFCLGSVMEDGSQLFIMRYGSYNRYFFAKWKALALLSGGLWLGQMAMLLLSSWGLPPEAGWGGALGDTGQWKPVFDLLAQFFPHPGGALLGGAFYLLLGYWLTGLLALWLGHVCSRTTAIKLLLGLYVLAILWMKLPVMSSAPFCYWTGLNHWVFLLHNLTPPWRLPLTIGVTFLVVMGMLASLRPRGRRRTAAPWGKTVVGLFPYYCRMLFTKSNLLLLVGLGFALAAWAWLSGGPPESGTEWTVRLLAGHGTGYWYLMGFLALLLAQVLPLWPVCRLLSQVVEEGSILLAVRLKRRQSLLQALLGVCCCWLLFWCLLLVVFATLPVWWLGQWPDFGLVALGVGLRLLDMAFQLLVMVCLLCCTGQVTVGFVCVLVLHCLCVLPVPWLPVGASSLLRLDLPVTGGVLDPAWGSTGLAVGCVVLLAWLGRRGIRRLFERMGG